MMPMDACQRLPQTLHSWRMLERNLEEMMRVNFVNLAAFAVSLSEFSDVVKLLVMVASLVYTITKIIQTIQEIRDKKK
jgi:chromate transport protein ChrA